MRQPGGAGVVLFLADDFAVPMGTGNGACNFGRSKGNGRNSYFLYSFCLLVNALQDL